MHVPRGAGGEGRGVAAFDGDGVEVAEQIEDDGAAVGADIEGEPGALGDGDVNGGRGAAEGGDVPLVGSSVGFGVWRGFDEWWGGGFVAVGRLGGGLGGRCW